MANEDLVGDVETVEAEIMPPVTTLDFMELLFCYKYVELRRNASQAAIAAGWKPSVARMAASRMLQRPDIRAQIISLVQPGLRKANIDMEEMLAQIHAIATFDRRKMYRPDGTRKLFTELDDKTAAAISHMGPNDFVPFSKERAIDMAMKHLGGFEKDNEQRRENLQIAVTFV